jgi:phage gp36-like protein
MKFNQSINLGKTFVPTSSNYSPKRIEDVKQKHDILGKATVAGRKNEPRSDDIDLDENQRALIDESQGFVASTTRLASAEITQRTNAAQALSPHPLDTALERANIARQVAEAKDLYRDDFETASKLEQRACRELRTMEEDNRRAPFSAIYKDDRPMFIALVVLLILGESVFNAFSFEELQDRGLLGGLMLALSVGVANVVMGLGTGFLGFRLMIHVRPAFRFLGIAITGVLLTAALALHLALGDLRETISHDAKAQIDFLVILKPWRWFAYTSIPPFVLFAVGLATYFVAALKGRGGSWGIVAPYWHHDVLDRRYRKAVQVLEDAKSNLKSGLQNAYDGELAKLRAVLLTETANVAEIRRFVAEAQGIERTMTDSINDEIGRQHIWLRTYRDRNQAVRSTPAPAYFNTYPDFEELRRTRLDLSALLAVAANAEQVLGENRLRVAELQQKTLHEQTATIEALLTMVSSAERRATQQINKEDAIGDTRNAQRAD